MPRRKKLKVRTAPSAERERRLALPLWHASNPDPAISFDHDTGDWRLDWSSVPIFVHDDDVSTEVRLVKTLIALGRRRAPGLTPRRISAFAEQVLHHQGFCAQHRFSSEDTQPKGRKRQPPHDDAIEELAA